MRLSAALLVAWSSAGLGGGCSVLFDPGGGGADASGNRDGDVVVDASGTDGAIDTDANSGAYDCDGQTLALYHFEGGGPELRSDSCANPSDDSFLTGGTPSEGLFDQGVAFDEVLLRGATTLPFVNNVLTVDMRVNPDASPQPSMGLIAWADVDGRIVFRMVLTRNGDDNIRRLEVERLNEECQLGDNAGSPEVIMADTWSHVGVIVSPADMIVVVNGSPAANGFPGGMCDAGELSYLVVGAGSNDNNLSDRMLGSMDELRISDSVRNDLQ